MTLSEIKLALRELGGGANKRLGQHFLIDSAVLKTIVEAADIHPGDLVLEIGPGLGVLTRELLANGAEVVAIEKDRRFVGYFNSPPTPPHESRGGARGGVRVMHGDAATIHWHEIIGDRPWKLISNLPYSITSLALRKALWAPRPASRVVVLVQKEVAQRIVAEKTSLLSLMVALASESARIIRCVPAGAFYPPPKVESAVLEIIPMTLADREKRWGIDPEKIMALAKKGFAHPRKKLSSNLRSPVGARRAARLSSTLSSDEASSPKSVPLQDVGIPERSRAEDLSPDDWAALARAVYNQS